MGGRRGRKGTQPSCAAAHEVRVPHPAPQLHSMHLPRNPQMPTRPSSRSGRPRPKTTKAKTTTSTDKKEPRNKKVSEADVCGRREGARRPAPPAERPLPTLWPELWTRVA